MVTSETCIKMIHFRIFSTQAQLIVLAILLNSFSYTIEEKGNLPDLNTIVDFLENVVKPYINAIQEPDLVFFRSKSPSTVEVVIDKKIAELQPYLQDYEESVENDVSNINDITLNGKDETTIIEFLPAGGNKKPLRNDVETPEDPLKKDIKKFKKMKLKIKHALMKESVSEKTQHMVTKTLDSMLAELINNQCKWKHGSNHVTRNHKLDKTALIANKWNEQWLQLKSHYTKHIGRNADKTFPGMKLYKFFEQFHEFLTHIIKDTAQLSNRYKIICQFVERKDKTLSSGRKDNSVKKKHNKCEKFKVCSGELKSFLTQFYISLNSASVTTIKNYGAMFAKDVNSENSQDKDQVVATIKEISILAKTKVANIFKKEVSKFELDTDKNPSKNLKALEKLIAHTIHSTYTIIQQNLDKDLEKLDGQLKLSIRQDLTANLDTDLRNLQKDFTDNICDRFANCNGKYVGRRKGEREPGDYNKNSVYVKVQMNLDDELKERLIARLGNVPKQFRNNNAKKYSIKPRMVTFAIYEGDDVRKHLHINVTRTTHDITTQVTETLPNINMSPVFRSLNDLTIHTNNETQIT